VKVKSAQIAQLKAGEQDGLAAGQFEAIVAVFGNKDSWGDIIVPGAFEADLAAWKASGDPIPVIWSHQWGDPDAHIGVVLEAREVAAGELGGEHPAGLWVKGQLDDDNPVATRVHKLLKGRRVKQFSFAYDEIDSGPGTHNGVEGWLLKALKTFEVGPTLVGMNQETTLLGAKSAVEQVTRSIKAGARHSAGDLATLKAMHDMIVELGVDCGDETGDGNNDDSKSRQGSTGQDTDGTKGADGADDPNLAPAVSPLVALAELDLLLGA
jgi:HK97 family phage prohead protease